MIIGNPQTNKILPRATTSNKMQPKQRRYTKASHVHMLPCSFQEGIYGRNGHYWRHFQNISFLLWAFLPGRVQRKAALSMAVK